MSSLQTVKASKYLIWLVGVSFVLFQFFLQLSSGVIINVIMQETMISAFTASLLSSAFYYVYTVLQIPAGLLYDRKNTRDIISCTALICSLGCLIFANSHSLLSLFMGRLMIGTGSAFAFVGLSHLLRQHFSMKQFGFLIGLSETLGFVVTVLGIIGLGILINYLGWRDFINCSAFLALIIAILAWRVIPTAEKQTIKLIISTRESFKLILQSKAQWINGLFVGLGFSLITVFAAMWSVPFIQAKMDCDLKVASILDAMIFLGAAISCPLFGYLANICLKRRPMMRFSCLATALFLFIILFYPMKNTYICGLFLFLTGLSCGAYMLTYTISNELSPPNALSTSTGFTNTLAMLTAPIFQLLVGFLLDFNAKVSHVYDLRDYQLALLILPINFIIAYFLVGFLPEKALSRKPSTTVQLIT